MANTSRKLFFADGIITEFDWNKCIFCQKSTKEKLLCSASNPNVSERYHGYETMAENLSKLHNLGGLSNLIDINVYKSGNLSITETFIEKSAKWHKSCSLKYNSTQVRRAEERKRKETPDTDENKNTVEDAPVRQKRNKTTSSFPDLCFFCDKPTENGQELHQVLTKSVDRKIRECVSIIGDSMLTAKLAEGDMIARECKYHRLCLVKLYNSCRISNNGSCKDDIYSVIQGIALSQVISYIQDARIKGGNKYPVFRMPVLLEFYIERINELCRLHNLSAEDISANDIHRTRLRENILSHFLDMRSEKSGREYVLVCEGAVGESIRISCESSFEDAVASDMVAKSIRRRISNSAILFKGKFEESCQEEAIDPLLLSFMNNLLYGKYKIDGPPSQPLLTICQLITFNMHTSNKVTKQMVKHQADKEPPIPVYLAMKVHAQTRKKGLVDMMHNLGLCISYPRLLRISSGLCETSVKRLEEHKVAFPPHFRTSLFTTAAYDNLDYNPSSTTSRESFHGTSISMFQHVSTEQQGSKIPSLIPEISSSKRVPQVPHEISFVKPRYLPVKEPPLPNSDGLHKLTMLPQETALTDEFVKEVQWLDNSLSKDAPSKMSWSAFHASAERRKVHTSLVGLLPLFHENSKSVAMMTHAMDIILKSTNFLNPGQGVVIAMDQPLYALAKTIQWVWPNKYGEEKIFLMFGSLHIEQDILRVLGKFLEGSGWTHMLSTSDITNPGTAESFLKVSNIAKTRLIHQITAVALYQLMHEAYKKYLTLNEKNSDVNKDFSTWQSEKETTIPMFKYWSTVLRLELLMLMFVRSQRSGNFNLFIETLKGLIPWFFTFDNYNYARWLPVFLKDLLLLQKNLPDVHKAFVKGMFVVQKTSNVFSAIGLDHAHEQNNAVIKGDGGAVGLFTDPAALRRWMLAGPEIADLITQFEGITNGSTKEMIHSLHHEDSPSFQNMFSRKVAALKSQIEEYGNPFLETSKELFSLETNITVDKEHVDKLMEINEIGRNQYEKFIEERLITQQIPLSSRIEKNNILVFRSPKNINKSALSLKSLKSDVDLFSKLFIISSTRHLDLDEFFCYENQLHPPSISVNGALRTGNKSSLLECLINELNDSETFNEEELSEDGNELSTYDESEQKQVNSQSTETCKMNICCDAIVYDGPALVHIRQPRSEKTFQDYLNSFKKSIVYDSERLKATRLDLIWDTYNKESTKAYVRHMRGTGERRHVRKNGLIPKNWQSFLRNSDNKTELFSMIAQDITSCPSFNDITVISTNYSDVISNTTNLNKTSLAPSNHEEADSRIFVHVLDIVQSGHKSICIRTVDTDVVVLGISFFHELNKKGLMKMWIEFGVGKHFRVIPVHDLAHKLGEEKSVALRGFHSFSGCDTTSFFSGRGKITMWKKWKDYPEVTGAFAFLSYSQNAIPLEIFQILERFIILCYSNSTDIKSVNEARKVLFTSGQRSMLNIPPTSEALKQHVLRSCYQSGHKWSSMSKNIKSPSICDWGWKLIDGKYVPIWSSLPEVSSALNDFIFCQCKKNCSQTTCGCYKNGLVCTPRCKNCNGKCYMAA